MRAMSSHLSGYDVSSTLLAPVYITLSVYSGCLSGGAGHTGIATGMKQKGVEHIQHKTAQHIPGKMAGLAMSLVVFAGKLFSGLRVSVNLQI